MRCPVLALEQGSPLAVVPVGGPSVFVPVSPSLDAVDFCSCHGTVSNLTISPHHLTSVDALASPPPPLLAILFSVPHCHTASPSHAPAHPAPAATVAPPMQIITSLPDLCLGARKQLVTHGHPVSLANQGREKIPMSTFNQSAIYPRVLPESPREAHPISK